ncbi:MAG: coproporphyrinogen dehydrogenase, partial [Xanthomonadales bacterium]|nr:coproporphyrinogen dehydrogenase [Xanthomonadales bacterium]
NRIQGVDETMGVIADARAAGFRSVSVDLIYGLPLQTLEGFARTLEIVIAGRPDRIAVYGYAHLPEVFKAQRQIDPADMPPASTRLALLGLAIDTLRQAGYQYLGMDHFALPQDELAQAQSAGDLQRNFQGYSTHAECDLVGLGVSAIGKVGDCYAANARDLTGYYAAIDAGHLAVMRGHRLTEDDTLRGTIIQALMCSGDLDMQAFGERHGFDFGQRFAAELNRLEPLVADGLVRIEAGHLRVTPRGRLLVRLVAMAFDAYLTRPGEKAPRYSRVI